MEMDNATKQLIRAIRAKQDELDTWLASLEPNGPARQKIMMSARREIAGGFTWVERAMVGEFAGATIGGAETDEVTDGDQAA